MGTKPGSKNISKREAQERMLQLLEQGATITAAMAAVGRNDVTFRQWSMQDPDFKARADKARLAGKGVKADLKDLKEISFPDFSENFLDSKIFNHQLNWIDLIEGNNPRWIPAGMTYNPGEPNRVLINVPPEHAKSTTITTNYVTHKIVTNPNTRVIIVSKTQGMARKFLGCYQDPTISPWLCKTPDSLWPQWWV